MSLFIGGHSKLYIRPITPGAQSMKSWRLWCHLGVSKFGKRLDFSVVLLGFGLSLEFAWDHKYWDYA